MLWLAAHFPRLGLEIFKLRQPSNLKRPLVLIEAGRVRLADGPAQKAGVVTGCNLATALSIAPQLIHFERDQVAERKRLHTLASLAQGFTSTVSLAPPAGLLLEVEGSLRLFGGLRPLMRRLRRTVRRLGHQASLAPAHTPAAALALARAELAPSLPDFPDAAQLRRQASLTLAEVPLHRTELDPQSIARLADMGIFKVGPLARLPSHELGKRFGSDLPLALGKLTGALPDPRVPEPPQERFRTAVHLLAPIANKTELLLPMRRLAVELEVWLNARQLGVRALRWRFSPLAGRGANLPVRFAKLRTKAGNMLEISRLALEKTDLPEEILSLSLAAQATEPRTPTSQDAGDLLATRGEAAAEAPMDFVDRVQARLGGEALSALRLVDDHRPECAWTTAAAAAAPMLRPTSKPRPRRLSSSAAPPAPSNGPPIKRKPPPDGAPMPRPNAKPLWLLPSPCPVSLDDYRLLSGPERIESGWWDQPVRRDYFVALAANGARCWLFQNRRDAPDRQPPHTLGQWFLHGYFA